MGVSKNRGTPLKWMIWGYHFFWKHLFVSAFIPSLLFYRSTPCSDKQLIIKNLGLEASFFDYFFLANDNHFGWGHSSTGNDTFQKCLWFKRFLYHRNSFRCEYQKFSQSVVILLLVLATLWGFPLKKSSKKSKKVRLHGMSNPWLLQGRWSNPSRRRSCVEFGHLRQL